LFWVPRGMSPRDGVYVRYPADELYAILCIESHRHQAEIVGENLGTVPDVVDRTMARHGISPLYVAQFAWTGQRSCPLDPPPPGAVASINTHDVPMFAAFWNGDDIQQRIEMDLLSPDQAEDEREARDKFRRSIRESTEHHSTDEEIFAALLALLRHLAHSDAGLVLLNLEDLWLERRPQNVPGTSNDQNWRRKVRYSLQQICSSPQVLAAVREVNKVPGRTHA